MYTTVTCTCMSPPKNIMCCFPCILVFAGHTMTSFCFPSSPFTFVSLLTANSSKEFLLAIFMTDSPAQFLHHLRKKKGEVLVRTVSDLKLYWYNMYMEKSLKGLIGQLSIMRSMSFRF